MVVPKQVVDQTRARFVQRTEQRHDHETAVEGGRPLEADTPDRVQKRMRRLHEHSPRPDVTAIALERILGRNDLMSVNYLELGIHVARCVGRITIRKRTGQTIGFGSCFTVSPRLLLTNNHVLPEASLAASSRVEFNYQEDLGGRLLTSVVLDFRPDLFFMTDVPLDYTLVAVSERAIDGTEVGGFTWLPLIEQEGKVIVGEYVNIIQHPNGEPKQLALRENRLIDLLPDFLHYKTDTAPGSSGSPVFNDQWEVVGLHHSGVPATAPDGQYLTHDGTLWQPEMGEHRIHWVANEGVRISRIVQSIRAPALSPEQDRLRREMFDGEPALPEARQASPPAPRRDGNSSPEPAEDGGATWIIPLEVSVRLAGGGARRAERQPPASGRLTDRLGAVVPKPRGGDLAGGTGMPISVAETDVQAALLDLERFDERPYYDVAGDEEARRGYYADVVLEGEPEENYRRLSELVARTHQPRLSYRPLSHVYPWVDLHPDGNLRSIYSGNTFPAEQFIREDAVIEAERARLVEGMRPVLSEAILSDEQRDAMLEMLESSMPYNCEHVVPQSWFRKAEPMRGDLHHLFACEANCNSFRGNFPYVDFPDFEEATRGECGKREAIGFEPSSGKGAVARATLYFLLRYPGEIDATPKEYLPERIDTLLSWHTARPPSTYERHRNATIHQAQGNRNPLIDHPDWAARIDFRSGLAGARGSGAAGGGR